jgi:branched-chain amino acid transport system substrate-binding protein
MSPSSKRTVSPQSTTPGRRRATMRLGRIALATALLSATALTQAAEYTVAVVQALTGGAAFIGTPVANGAALAAEEINRKQELGAGNTIKVITADDANDRSQTLSLMQRYAADPNILMFMGPTSGAVAVAAANAANTLKLPMQTQSNSMDVLKAGPWSFTLTQPGEITLPYIANYAVDKLKIKDCTVIGIHDVEIYVTMQKVFENVVKSKGGKIGSVEAIKGTDADFSALATKVVGRDADCVFISASAPQAANIVIQLRQAGLDPNTRILGHNALSSPQFLERGGKAVEGVYLIGDWLPGTSDEASRAFSAAYKAKYKVEPDNWAAWGYSSMRVTMDAIKQAGPNPTRESIRQAMAKAKNVPVLVGNGKYTRDAERVPFVGMHVLQVKNGTFVMAP